MVDIFEGNNKTYLAAAAAIVVVVAIAIAFISNGATAPQTNNAVAPTPAVFPTPVAACAPGAQKDFECVGSISGTQTYYECNNGAWESKSRYNYSECVKTFGPNETAETTGAENASAEATPDVPGTVGSAVPPGSIETGPLVPTIPGRKHPTPSLPR